MLNLYPANKLENLSFLLNKILSMPSGGAIFESDVIVTQSQGMKHWVNLQLAEQTGIAMNLDYQMPMQFMWAQLRNILGNTLVPKDSPFESAGLSWEIYALLGDDRVKGNSLFDSITRYWLKDGVENEYLRYQLSVQLADLFQEYLIYRPDWVVAWEQNLAVENLGWQSQLWRMLVNNVGDGHIVNLIETARANLDTPVNPLPKRVCFFGVASLPPLWMEFLNLLSDYVEIHFFQLNPCCEYWGDVQSEKQLAKWMALGNIDEAEYVNNGNALLGFLGKQGKDFLSLLPEHSVNEIPVFESPVDIVNQQPNTCLEQLQTDILNMVNHDPNDVIEKDDSVTIVSAHSGLREVQGLHDYLLSMFDKDPTLLPQDVLVMCPKVADYAPYISAVFKSPYERQGNIPRLPYSIADRSLRTVQPNIEIFEQLLMLPDSRFQVDEIIKYLQLPAIALKFDISLTELQTIEVWLKAAAVKWGIDAEHKQQVIHKDTVSSNPSASFTWQQGLSRLMMGFALSDEESVYQGKLSLPCVEGNDVALLGKLMLLVEQLSEYAYQLQLSRTPEQWYTFLLELKNDLFEELEDDHDGNTVIMSAIDALYTQTISQHFEEKVGLSVVRKFLSDQFGEHEMSMQFMAGQVTFCSMVPMRSVPFKVICMLGLNDGAFPRQDNLNALSLLNDSSYRKGDRSRRIDDKYLFLEAIISARKAIYLSYQGVNAKNNTPQNPSIVLAEFMRYLEMYNGWSKDRSYLKQLPLQPFTLSDQENVLPFYDRQWLRINSEQLNTSSELMIETKCELSLNEVYRFFKHPVKSFVNETLGVVLNDTPDNTQQTEPFQVDHLTKYEITQKLVEEAKNESELHAVIERELLRGTLPEVDGIASTLNEWAGDASEFVSSLPTNAYSETRTLNIDVGQYQLSAELNVDESSFELFEYRFAVAKGNDYLNVWLKHLVANVFYNGQITSHSYHFNAKNKRQKLQTISLNPVTREQATQYLINLVSLMETGLSQPLVIDANTSLSLLLPITKKATLEEVTSTQFESLWVSSSQARGLNSDPYIDYAFDSMPDFDVFVRPNMLRAYLPLLAELEPSLKSLLTGSFQDVEYSEVNSEIEAV